MDSHEGCVLADVGIDWHVRSSGLPRHDDRWTFIGRGDIGGGNADLTWSGLVGFEVRIVSWGGLEFGYKARRFNQGAPI